MRWCYRPKYKRQHFFLHHYYFNGDNGEQGRRLSANKDTLSKKRLSASKRELCKKKGKTTTLFWVFFFLYVLERAYQESRESYCQLESQWCIFRLFLFLNVQPCMETPAQLSKINLKEWEHLSESLWTRLTEDSHHWCIRTGYLTDNMATSWFFPVAIWGAAAKNSHGSKKHFSHRPQDKNKGL